MTSQPETEQIDFDNLREMIDELEDAYDRGHGTMVHSKVSEIEGALQYVKSAAPESDDL